MFKSREELVLYIEEEFPDYIDEILLLDGHEESFCGIVFGFGGTVCAAYDIVGVKNSLMSDGMSEEEAEEWFEFNMIGAYVGEHTPVYIRRIGSASMNPADLNQTTAPKSICSGNHPLSLN